MKQLLLSLALLKAISPLHAQYTLSLVVLSPDTNACYIAGSFNHWNPADEAHRLHGPGNKTKTIVPKNMAAGSCQFKFTQGSWATVETDTQGTDVANREIILSRDTSLTLTIAAWKTPSTGKPRVNTASAQVQILDTAFYMPQLDRRRRIWIYLPSTYSQQKDKRYPVLYMQDGQNLFNEQTAPFGEWGVDECLDTAQQRTGIEWIVIGIDHGGDKRITEYNPYNHEQYGSGEGAQYAAFLATTLKPYIDGKFRTLKDARHTYIAGSSLGGLIALYAVMKYPDIFGGAGIFSPALWIAPPLHDQLAQTTWKDLHRFYFYAGGMESPHMIQDMDTVIDVIKAHQQEVFRSVDPQGQHNEKYWRQHFYAFYTWLPPSR